MSPPSASTNSRAPSASIFHSAAGAVIRNPADRLALFHPRQFHDAAVLAHGFADALVALLVLHLHAADVGGNADVVGDKNQKRIGIRILAVVFDGGQFFFVRSAAKKILHAAHEENLKRRHERRSAGAVENLRQIVFGEIELKETEVPQIGRHQVLEDRVAKAFAEKGFIAHEDVGRAQLARFQFADKALGLGEGPHQIFRMAVIRSLVVDRRVLSPARDVGILPEAQHLRPNA